MLRLHGWSFRKFDVKDTPKNLRQVNSLSDFRSELSRLRGMAVN